MRIEYFVAMFVQKRIESCLDLRTGCYKRGAPLIRDRTLILRQQVQEIHERHPIDIQRAHVVAGKELHAARVLRLELRDQGAETFRCASSQR